MSVKFEYAEFKDIIEYIAKPAGISAEIIGDKQNRLAQFYLTGHHNSSILKDPRNLISWVYAQLHPHILNDPKKLAKLLEKLSSTKQSMEILPFGVLSNNGSLRLDVMTECHYRKLEDMRKSIKKLETIDNKIIKEQIGRLQSLIDIYQLHGEEFMISVKNLEIEFPGYKVHYLDGKKKGGRE